MNKLKTFCTLILAITILILSYTQSQAITQQETLYIKEVIFDFQSNIYCLSCLDTNGNGFIIELFKTNKLSMKTLNRLDRAYRDNYIVCDIDNLDNTDITDDIIIEWEMVN